MEVLYGIPIYSVHDWGTHLQVPFFRVSVKKEDELIVNAYKYLIIRFNQYLILKYGCKVVDYNPISGVLVVSGFESKDEVYDAYNKFVEEYFIPKLMDLIEREDINVILNIFYYRKGESNQSTGIADVIIPAKFLSKYPKMLLSGEFKIQAQKSVKRKLETLYSKLSNSSYSYSNDLVIVKSSGKVDPLNDSILINALTDVKNITSNSEGDVDSGICFYCRLSSSKLLDCKGKLGPGRMRLRQEVRTNISGRVKMCLRCVLVTVFYVLDTKLNQYLGSIGDTLLTFKVSKKLRRNLGSETLNSIYRVLELLSVHEKSIMLYNSLFGDERVRANIEGLNELSIERLALLLSVLGQRVFSKKLIDNTSSELILHVSSSNFIPHIIQILKQFEKGGLYMSYVSRYLRTHIYVEPENRKVAYVLAKLMDSVLNKLLRSEMSEDEKNYTIRRFAQILRTSGITKALSYAIPRIGKLVKLIDIRVDGIEKTITKEVLNKLNIKYSEDNDIIKVNVESLIISEINIVEKYSQSIFDDIYMNLVVLNPIVEIELISRKGGSSVGEGE